MTSWATAEENHQHGQPHPPAPPPTRTPRCVAARTGRSLDTVQRWYLQRAATRFPDKADTDRDGRDWFWQHDIDAFHTEHLARRAAAFTPVDRSGRPEDLLTGPQAAQVLHYKNHRSLPAELLDHPDQIDTLPSGRLRRRWYRTTIWAYADGRALRYSTGRPPGSGTAQRQPHPYADDPRLDPALALLDDVPTVSQLGALLARRLGIGDRTAQRLLAVARVRRAAPPPWD
jgi:hypothetical protein